MSQINTGTENASTQSWFHKPVHTNNAISAREVFSQLAFGSWGTVQPHRKGRYLEVWSGFNNDQWCANVQSGEAKGGCSSTGTEAGVEKIAMVHFWRVLGGSFCWNLPIVVLSESVFQPTAPEEKLCWECEEGRNPRIEWIWNQTHLPQRKFVLQNPLTNFGGRNKIFKITA